jgi:hypothetical protein
MSHTCCTSETDGSAIILKTARSQQNRTCPGAVHRTLKCLALPRDSALMRRLAKSSKTSIPSDGRRPISLHIGKYEPVGFDVNYVVHTQLSKLVALCTLSSSFSSGDPGNDSDFLVRHMSVSQHTSHLPCLMPTGTRRGPKDTGRRTGAPDRRGGGPKSRTGASFWIKPKIPTLEPIQTRFRGAFTARPGPRPLGGDGARGSLDPPRRSAAHTLAAAARLEMHCTTTL